jgi:hypothetical protein
VFEYEIVTEGTKKKRPKVVRVRYHSVGTVLYFDLM